MMKKEDDDAQDIHGFRATIDAKTPEEFSKQLHAAALAYVALYETQSKPGGK